MDEKMITPFFPAEKIKEAVNAINQKESGGMYYPLISSVQIGEYLAEEMLKQEEKQTVVPNFFAEISKLAVQNEQEKSFKLQAVSGIPYLCFPDILCGGRWIDGRARYKWRNKTRICRGCNGQSRVGGSSLL